MFDAIAPFDVVLVIAAVASPAVLLARIVSRGEKGSLATLFAAPGDASWPRGVQEDEPQPWAFGHAAPNAA